MPSHLAHRGSAASSSPPAAAPVVRHPLTSARSKRRCSLLVVVGWATAYFAVYILILAHKMKVFQEWQGRIREDETGIGVGVGIGRMVPYGESNHNKLPRNGPHASSDAGSASRVGKISKLSAQGSVSNSKKRYDISSGGNNKTNTNKNAYSFLVAGCDPDDPWRYRAYLYGVAVSIHSLQSYGSYADFHVYVELMHGTRHATLLPEEEVLLASLKATIHYIPTDPQQSFYRSQLYKFLILNLTEYDHVFYMDSDVLPLANLDYLFEAMDRNVLRRNVAFLGKREPANGGSFILSPREGALRLVHDLIVRKERSVWNETVGWGVDAMSTPQFTYPTTKLGERTSWDFFGAEGDQGLLYYWIKFVERDASFVSTVGAVWQWGSSISNRTSSLNLLPPTVLSSDSDPQLLPTFLGKVASAADAMKKAGIDLPPGICFEKHRFCFSQRRPRKDFFHFTGNRKPWVLGLPEDFGPETRLASVDHYWFSLLKELNDIYQLGLDFAQEGGPLAPLRELNATEDANESPRKTSFSSSSAYEMKYRQKSGPRRVYTRLIRDDESDVALNTVNVHVAKTRDGSAKNAYSFLIGACDPDQPDKYRYFLYSVMVIVRILQSAGSIADFHVWVEMFHLSSHDRLPPEEERVLRELGVTVHYIGGKRPEQSFYALQLQKFRILGMTQYKHVMYLDSDIIPLVNLDFLFDWIDEGILKPYVGFVGKAEPINGGSFIVSPREGAVEQINNLINEKEHRPWNDTFGWGHTMTPPDRYLTNFMGPQTTWDFHGGDTDQGLLYYWTKYVEKDVSMILKNFTVEHWSRPADASSQDEFPVRTADYRTSYVDRIPPKIPACNDARDWCGGEWNRQATFIHLTGNVKAERKPWLRGLPSDYSDATKYDSVYHLWFSVLDEINVQHRLGLDLKREFGVKLSRNVTILKGYNDAFKQKRVDGYTSIID